MAQDPTFQTEGVLEIGLKTIWNISNYMPGSGSIAGLPISFNMLTYGPVDQPPPPWVEGSSGQYQAMQNGTAYGFGAMLPNPSPQQPTWIGQAGVAETVYVGDMSSASVQTGKTYAFTVNVGGYWIQLYCMITGVPDGSTLIPGFGLWNLGTNPHAWTYVKPGDFSSGEWQISLLSPTSFSPVQLAVEYAPPKNYGQGVEARLIFTCSGDGVTSSPWYPGSVASLSQQGRPTQIQHIHDARSDAYTVIEG